MGTFNVKNFFGSMFTPVEDEMEENYYGEEEGYIEEDAYEQEPIAEETYYEEPRTFVQEQPAVTTPVMQHNATVIMLTPYDIRTSQIVCDHIREGHIVICNLTNTFACNKTEVVTLLLSDLLEISSASSTVFTE